MTTEPTPEFGAHGPPLPGRENDPEGTVYCAMRCGRKATETVMVAVLTPAVVPIEEAVCAEHADA